MTNFLLKTLFVLVIVIGLVTLSFSRVAHKTVATRKEPKGVNGGGVCMGCTLVVTLLRQLMQVYEFTPEKSIDFLCNLFPGDVHFACVLIKGMLKEFLVDKLNSDDSADVVCYSLGLCHVDAGYKYCHLFPEPEVGMEKAVRDSRARIRRSPITERMPFCKIKGLQTLCANLNLEGIDDNTPVFDEDKDMFSTVENFRGYDWRGRDCGDGNSDAYPGRMSINSDIDYDSNCNGIWGINPITGAPYEEELCGDQENKGIIIIGDSISAHFHIPPDWIRANVTSPELWENLTFIVGNELDWPHMSYGTGFVTGSGPVTINSPTNSLYWRLRNRNLCVHRDYHNLAFNGAHSGTAYKGSMNMARDQGYDKPVLLIYAQFGNDICRSDHGTVDEMTPVDEFKRDVLDYLDYLDTRLPKNSDVILVGLVNGSHLYDILKGRLHPIGELNEDITYDDMYTWFSCMQEVCPGWTNTNVTRQKEATAHAYRLSGTLQEIAESGQYSRFNVHFLHSPMDEAIKAWPGERWELIEPVDGLHPSKNGQDVFTNVIWKSIEQNFPEILEKVNPNNDKIGELFGDQGGH